MFQRALVSSALALTLGCEALPVPEAAAPPPIQVSSFGSARGRGNLLALQVFVSPADYASEGRLFARLSALLEHAGERGLLNERTVVVLPEHVGTWLIAEGESAAVFAAATTSDAMGHVVAAHPAEWLAHLTQAPAEDGATYAAFATKAERMASVYEAVMGRLAQEHAVTLVAGSILLPGPRIEDHHIVVQEGAALVNAAFVFDASGALMGAPVVKSFPTDEEQPFLAAGDPSALPVFETPAGRLGVLVCADSWFPDAWRALDEQQAEIVAVPVFISPSSVWDEPWQGYSGQAAPDDVDPADVGVLSEREAWQKYSLPGRLKATRVRAGVTAPLKGQLWDLGSDGQPLLSLPGESATEAPLYEGPALINVWL